VATLAEALRQNGVVGAGGAGFPTSVKSEAKVEFVIANGAECEPLVHKDVELMQAYPGEILSGLRLMMRATDAKRGIFGLKEKNATAVEAIRSHIGEAEIDVVLLGDFYPSGDEFELVHIATGRLIPPAGIPLQVGWIPLQVGCVVNNVETLYNVNLAVRGTPVTRKFISVTGAVKEPKSFWVPIGTTFRKVLELVGGTTVAEFGLFISGLMMGTLTFDLDDAVTKTTAGLIVLPRDHYLITRMDRTVVSMNHIGKSATR
jgi:Na+-translocating ferredoxin:NAD+ oxidoreductase RnfC subunit